MILLASLLLANPAQDLKTIELGRRALITASVKIRKGDYLRPTEQPYDVLTDGVIVIRGDGITVDFNGATIRGSSEDTEPDKREGTGIFVDGDNVTIKNAKVRGYHIGLQARNCSGLKIVDCDFSYNWKQHLHSTLDREDESDWQSYHHNDNDEWIRGNADGGIPA